MAHPTCPVSEWSEEDVINFDINRWDHALLKMAGYDTSDYSQLRNKIKPNPKSRPETIAKARVALLQSKRALLTKLMELRSTANQAQSSQLRTASSVIQMTRDDAGDLVNKMVAISAKTAT